MSGAFWTAAEKRKLRRAFARGGLPASYKALPLRTENSVELMVRKLGLLSARRWTEVQLSLLVRHWDAADPAQALRMLPGRTLGGLDDKVRALRNEHSRLCPLTGPISDLMRERPSFWERMKPPNSPWTSREVATLQVALAHDGIKAARQALPQRSIRALTAKALDLALQSPNAATVWDGIDKEILAGLYPKLGGIGAAARLTWRTPGAIRRKAQAMGLVAQSWKSDRSKASSRESASA